MADMVLEKEIIGPRAAAFPALALGRGGSTRELAQALSSFLAQRKGG